MSKILGMLSRGNNALAEEIRPWVEEPSHPLGERSRAAGEGLPVALAGVRELALRLPAPSPLFPFESSQWRVGEQYRILRTKIGQHPKQPRLIVITSPCAGDGKTVSAINLAGALSLKSEAQVLLLDADLRKPSIHRQLGLPETPGLADVLRGTSTPHEALVQTQEFPNLYVMPAGTRADNPGDLLDSAAWGRLCGNLRDRFRYVVVDSPPAGAVADSDLIQAVCDGVILVVRPDRTNRQLCRKAIEEIPKARLLGVLLNCVRGGPR